MTTGGDDKQNRDEMKGTVTIQPPTVDPLHSLISSERYVESLENKLKRLKGQNAREPNSKDILKSLEKVRDSQMVTLMQDSSINSSTSGFDDDYATSVLNTNYSGKQQSKEEIASLLHNDALAKGVTGEEETDTGTTRTDTGTTKTEAKT